MELLCKWNQLSLVKRILIGLILGAVLGFLLPGASFLSLLGTLFVGALKALAPLLVFFLVLHSLAQHKKGAKSNMSTVIALYLIGTLLAALCAVVASFLFPSTLALAQEAASSAPGGIGGTITAAAEQSPLVMGFLLGGIMKMICTSPLSSMALTAMLGLTGLPMGIAAIACFGGSFTNGMVFHKMHYGNKSNIIAVMLEPLTQAHIVTAHPIPIFVSNFFGGGLAGLAAAALGIVNNAPGTASPIPGMIAPFGFNPAGKVVLALALAALGGALAGYVGGTVFSRLESRKKAPAAYADPLADDEEILDA